MDEYRHAYSWYKKVPILFAVIIALIFLACAVTDILLFSEIVYEGTKHYYQYGITNAESLPLLLFVWWAIGTIASLTTYVLTTILISPIIIQTELLLKRDSESSHAHNAQFPPLPPS